MPKKKVGSIVTLKNGARAKVLPTGRYRFISGPTRGHAKKKKGGSASVAGGLGTRLGARADRVVSRARSGVAYALGGSVKKRRKKKRGGSAYIMG